MLGVDDEARSVVPAVTGALSMPGTPDLTAGVGFAGAGHGGGGNVVLENAYFATDLDVEGFMRQAAWAIQTRTA